MPYKYGLDSYPETDKVKTPLLLLFVPTKVVFHRNFTEFYHAKMPFTPPPPKKLMDYFLKPFKHGLPLN